MEPLHMDAVPDGPTLLVGEGDFSFSVAMTTKLPLWYHSSIVATSFETPETIMKHIPAEENMATLTEKGIVVRLSTDATRLHSDPFFKGRRFARIIFNFPHTGGKSNLKRNRKLLNDFFASASQILEVKGHIMVTLCKGQGGTASDRPMRKWHDSWQVVSMAANSGFILVKIWPFSRDRYTVYTSTGFRSQDKGFHTDNALTHVFERAECVVVPTTVKEAEVKVNEAFYTCPVYLHQIVQTIRKIKDYSHHPVHSLYQRLVARLRESETCVDPDWTICDKGFQKSVLVPIVQQSNAGDGVSLKADNEVRDSDSLTPYNDICTLKICDNSKSHFEHYDDCSDVLLSTAQKACDECCEHYRLASSLDEVVESESDMGTDKMYCTAYGVVFNNVPLSHDHIPQSFNILITWQMSHDKSEPKILESNHQDIFSNSESKHCQSTQNCRQTESVSHITRLVKKLEAVFSTPDKHSKLSFIQHESEHRHGAVHTLGNITWTESVVVGKVSVVDLSHITTNKHKIMMELDLSKLTCLMYKIAPEILLWSNDWRVKQQLEKLCDNLEQNASRELKDDLRDVPNRDNPELNHKHVKHNSSREIKDDLGDEPKGNNPGLNNEGMMCRDTDKRDLQSGTRNDKNTVEASMYVGSQTGCTDLCTVKENKDTNKQVQTETGSNKNILNTSTVVQSQNESTGLGTVKEDKELQRASNNAFIAPSVYPLTSVHDMSFWQNPSIPFNESIFHNIIRNIAGDVVISAELIDVFTDPSSCRTSRCYRLTFRSADKCLSYDCSWKLQSFIRLEVERCMKIILR